jgi:hypothetical protein
VKKTDFSKFTKVKKTEFSKFNNLYRYDSFDNAQQWTAFSGGDPFVVGLCTLNQVDPYPITYSLSNP